MVNVVWTWLAMLLSESYRAAVARLVQSSCSCLSMLQRSASRKVQAGVIWHSGQQSGQDEPSDHSQPSDHEQHSDHGQPSDLDHSDHGPQILADTDLERTCDICMDAKKTEAFVPCGHMLACETCAEAVIKGTGLCPACSRVVSGKFRVYIT